MRLPATRWPRRQFFSSTWGQKSHLEAPFPLGNVLLWVEEDDVDFGHVEHSQRHGGRQAEGDGQGGGLDVHLGGAGRQREEHCEW